MVTLMQMPQVLSRRLSQVFTGFAVAGLVFLTGCANMVATAPATTPLGVSHAIAGNVHGGQQPVFNAIVRLYAAGTSGYGTGSTLLATSANSDLSGSFAFTKLGTMGGVIDSTLPTWQCPSVGNPQIYITAIGGNTQGTGVTSTNNTAAGFIAALGPCSGTSTGTFVSLNEISTVASVFALAQYINPGTTPGTETIGTSSSTQGTVGLNNAAASIANLANISGGQAITTTAYPGLGTAVGATLTATPESAKLITIANILAACINTPASSSNQCADLFANAVPPAASVTSQPSASFAPAQDTIQAAYYMAVNPSDGNAAPSSCATTPGATTRLACLYGLSSSLPPFQPNLAAAPSDWTIGVTYVGSGACTDTGFLISGPYHAAIDANGNVWYINGGSTTANLVELSPVGQPMVCTGFISNGRGLTIDANGNVWGSFNGTATNGIVEWPAGGSALITWPVASGAQTYEMTSDGFGNVFYSQNAGGGTIWEFINPGTTTTPFAPVQIAGPLSGTGTITQGYIQVDPAGRIWDATSTSALLFDIYPKTPAQITGYQVSGGTVTFTAPNTFSVGNIVQVSGLTSPEGLTLDHQTYTVTAANASTFSAATTGATIGATADAGTAALAGSYSSANLTTLNTSYGMAIDSSNFLYQGTTCCAGTGDREAVKLTPGAVGTATFSASAQDIAGINGTRSVVVDGASNVFVGNEFPNSLGATATVGTYSISEYTSSGSGTTATFTALSPSGSIPASCTTSGCGTTGGYFKADFNEPLDMQVDPSGNLWVMNSGTSANTTNGTTITEVVGAAVPVATPLSIAVKNNQLGTKP
jgi:hypothetical protein